ncbi:MAG: NosD domain-containing protein [Hyphomicrobiales bacterium]
MKELLAKATKQTQAVSLDCSVTLSKADVVTKRIEFVGIKSSNAVFNCGGGTLKLSPIARPSLGYAIFISSEKVNDKWERPENIRIRNCTILGGIRIKGLGFNGEGKDVRASSLKSGHTKRAQASAPTNIQLDRVKINALGSTAIYASPGVTKLQLRNSKIFGTSVSAAIYLDAESAHHVITDNVISVANKRELIAVDGAANVLIARNRFSNLETGGIYLYRNCGEGGTIRHQAPQRNQIVDNHFYYNKFKGRKLSAINFVKNLNFRIPAIWLGQRNGKRPYCSHDKGFAFGSSKSNASFADNNLVKNNQIVKIKAKRMIIDDGKNNRIIGNRTVKR